MENRPQQADVDTLLSADEKSFTFFTHPITNVYYHSVGDLYDVHSLIKLDVYKSITEKLRALPQDQRGEFKKTKFDYVTFSGSFTQRNTNALVNRSCYFHVDIDKIGGTNAVESAKQKILSGVTPALMFVSPSGNGLKVVYQIDTQAGDHSQYFKAFERYYKTNIGFDIDGQCKDIARACFICHDPDAYFNNAPAILGDTFLKTYSPPEIKAEIPARNTGEALTDVQKQIAICRISIDKNFTFLNGNRNKYITELAGMMHRTGVPKPDALAECLRFEQPDFTSREITTAVESIYKNEKFAGCNPLKDSKPQTKTEKPKETPSIPYFQSRSIGEVFEAGAKEPERLRIFGDFLRQQTNTLLYSNTNYGKSMLAFQIAVNAATGNSFENNEIFRNECPPMRVLLVDMEMDDYTLTDRHARAWDHYDNTLLNDNLHILHENPDASAVYGDTLLKLIEDAAIKSKAELIIIDNLTKICPDLLKADTVSIAIDTLRRIRQKTGASFLVIGHTIKTLQNSAITENSYYGSAHIANFFTEIFYLDKTITGKFFLKHAKTKQRDAWTDTVPVLRRGDHDRDGVGFTFESLQSIDQVQMPHANQTFKRKPSDYKHEIKLMTEIGISQTKIAEIFGCSRSAICQLIDDTP